MSLKLGLRNKIRRSRSAGAGFTGLLDQSFASGATAAYSLRKLKSSATKAVRVREDSGNTETDIGFSGGTLDETGLLNHCGSNNGFVTKWYDQSGNGNDAINATAAEQPKLYDRSSGLKTLNSKPTIQFDGSDDLLGFTSFDGTNDLSSFSVSALNADSIGNIISSASSGKAGHYIRYSNKSEFNVVTFGGSLHGISFGFGFSFTLSELDQITAIIDDLNNGNADYKLFINDTKQKEVNDIYDPDTDWAIGARGFSKPLQYLDGFVSEIVLYDKDKEANQSDIASNQKTFYGI